MAKNENIIKRGKWYHEFTIPCQIYITARGADKGNALYYVQYEALGDPGNIGSEAGPFHTVTVALEHARTTTNGTLRWV